MSRATDAATGAAFVAIDDDDGNPTVVFATLAGDDGALAAELRAMCANVVDGRFAFPERRAAARARTTDGATTTTRFTFCLTRADGARTIGAVRRVGARRAAAALTRTARFEYHDDVLRHAMTRAMEALDATARGTTRELARGDALWEYLDRTIGTRAPTAGDDGGRRAAVDRVRGRRDAERAAASAGSEEGV